jgi:hypothetical protein
MSAIVFALYRAHFFGQLTVAEWVAEHNFWAAIARLSPEPRREG